jgi:xanthine/uracil permease
MLCGFQHSLAMLAGIIAPPMILASSLSLPPETQSYLVSASLISSGLLSAIQMSRMPVPIDRFLRFISAGRWSTQRKYYLGTGLLTVVGTSFSTLTTATGIFASLYANGTCPSTTTPDGITIKGPCPEAYGYLIGTAALCSLLEIILSFVPVRQLRRAFPPLITGAFCLPNNPS